jgi:hypothetical protein
MRRHRVFLSAAYVGNNLFVMNTEYAAEVD